MAVGSVAVHPLGDVRRLLLDRDHHAAGLPVEAHRRVRVADTLDHVADDRREVELGSRGDFPGDHNEAGLGQGLAGHPAGLVLAYAGVENRVGHLVAQLVGMAFGNTLGGEQVLGHEANLPWGFRTQESPSSAGFRQ